MNETLTALLALTSAPIGMAAVGAILTFALKSTTEETA